MSVAIIYNLTVNEIFCHHPFDLISIDDGTFSAEVTFRKLKGVFAVSFCTVIDAEKGANK